MTTTIESAPVARDAETELVTFYVGDLLLGADIRYLEEINRHTEPTPVPHAPDAVRGVMNLRGEVVTVLDLRTILGLGRTETGKHTRNVVVNVAGERTGLLVDRIADVVTARSDDIQLPPANMTTVCGKFLQGVYQLNRELLAVLDAAAVLRATGDAA